MSGGHPLSAVFHLASFSQVRGAHTQAASTLRGAGPGKRLPQGALGASHKIQAHQSSCLLLVSVV
jgi:hypothetical protein